jgi:hypothetical protein
VNPGTTAGIVVAVLLLCALGIVGTADRADEEYAERAYCADVHAHAIPDYRGNYKKNCENGLPRR